MLKIIRSLSSLSKFSEFCYLEKEYDKFPEFYDKLTTIIKFINPKSTYRIVKGLDNCTESDSIIMISPSNDLMPILNEDSRVHLLVIDTEYMWGKFDCLYELITNNLINSIQDFQIENWKKYIHLHGLRFVNQHSDRFINNSWYITRFRQQGPLKYLPVIRKDGIHKTKRYMYGHGGGYPIHYLDRDSSIKSKVDLILSKLSDESSKEFYRTVIYGEPQKLWEQYFNNLLNHSQYFDYIKLNESSMILNAGVEGGFELPFFLSFNVNHIFSIDPLGKSCLSEYSKAWCKNASEQLTFINKVLYKIENTNESESEIYDSTTLEEVINEHNINRLDLIKTDIEGAERNIFSELQPIIEKFRPQLAIAIYHTDFTHPNPDVSDLIEMPLKLFKACVNYNFYIKTYSYERWETIMYCIPREISTEI